MRLLFFVCVLSFSIRASAQPGGNDYELQDNVKKQLIEYYYDFDSTKLSARGYVSAQEFSDLGKKMGEWTYFYENGNVKQVINYVRGYIHGKVVDYYPNGNKKNLGYFYWGVQDSLFRSWAPEGKLVEAGEWDHGKKVGKWTYTYPDGKPFMVEQYRDTTALLIEFYDKEGKHTVTEGNGTKKTFFEGTDKPKEVYNYKEGYMHGVFTEYYESGKKAVTGSFDNGLQSGNWKYWYFNGIKIKDINFKKGELNGPYKRYYTNGELQVEGQYKDNLKTGNWIWYSRFGTKDISGQFVEDLRQGEWKEWHPGGKLKSVGNYVNDKKTGKWEKWFEDGTLEAVGYFEDNKRTGDWVFNFENGNLWKKGPFLNDKRHGEWITYFESGQKLSQGAFIAGEEDGLWQSWYESGQMMDEGSFKNGVMHGEWHGWYPNGHLRYEGQREEDLEIGHWKYYFQDGSLYQEGDFKRFKLKHFTPNGGMYATEEEGTYQYTRKHGEWKSYSQADKKLTSVGSYKEGKQQGTWKYFFEGGQVVAFEKTYTNGILDGKSVEYYRNGQVKAEINYKDGAKHGPVKVYDQRGKLIYHVVYKNGLIEKDIINKRKYRRQWKDAGY